MVNSLTSLFLKRRGYTQQYLQEINDGKHQQLKNVKQLSTLLRGIHDRRDKIVIMPDFDTDGISAGTVGFAGLSELGFNVGIYMPHPEKSYGIRVEDIKNVKKLFPSVKYIISCDVGITCYDAFFYANSIGIKVLITDHHEEEDPDKKAQAKYDSNSPQKTLFDQKVVPLKNGQYRHLGLKKLYCETIVNPCQLGETYSLRDICGAFVFWQVLNYYAHQYGNSFTIEQINRLRVFAGIGTIGDMMRLINENRVLIKDTVAIMRFIYNNGDSTIVDNLPGRATYKRAFKGLFLLFKGLANNKQLMSSNDLDEKFLGWTIAPIYNSIKRLEMPMGTIFGVFCANNTKVQENCVKQVIAANEKRKTMVTQDKQQIDDEAKAGLQPYAPFIYLTDAPGGVLGLLANQYEQQHRLPSFVINKYAFKGSGRSFSYFPAFTRLKNTEFTVKGHEEAFGIEFSDIQQVERFYQYLLKNVLPLAIKDVSQHKDDCDLTLAADNDSGKADAILNMHDCWEFHKNMLNLKPFGAGFAEPKIRIKFDPQNAQFITMGKNKEHLKVVLSNNLQLISWKNAKLLPELKQKKDVNFVGDFSFNNFMGRTSLQMIGNFEKKHDLNEEFDLEKA